MRHEMSAGYGQTGVLTGAASRLPGRSPAVPRREEAGVVMVSETLVARWEAVYREYGLVSEMVSNSVPGDGAVARRMARASADVAAVWREMTNTPDLPWWELAALGAAAQAFERQAQDWTARAKHERQAAGSGSVRGLRVTYPIAVPHPDQRQGGVADV
jgi:hypothetical protein